MTTCPHCYPYEPTHALDRINFLVELGLSPIARFVPHRLGDIVWSLLLWHLALLRVGRWRSIVCSDYDGKRRALWAAAEARGIPVERFFVLGQQTSIHRAYLHNRWMIVDELLPTIPDHPPFHPVVNDKSAMRAALAGIGIPVPEGRMFWSSHRAARYAQNLSPCVVKSRDGSLSKHVMVRPTDFDAAIRVVKDVCSSVIVERFVEGDVFRATTVHGRFVAAMRRVPAGEGRKVVMADGARMVDVTDRVHPKNRELFERAARVAGGGILGIDFITLDPSRSWDEQAFAVIEVNSFPNFEMHHEPDEGRPRDVAGVYWDGFTPLSPILPPSRRLANPL